MNLVQHAWKVLGCGESVCGLDGSALAVVVAAGLDGSGLGCGCAGGVLSCSYSFSGM